MKRLSSPIENMNDHYDVIVIGSGYGGSITASRMARTGKKVCLLERGKEFQPGEYPNTVLAGLDEMQMNTPKGHLGKTNSLYDAHVNHDINVFKGCGLGGTSLVNANVGLKPNDRVLEQTCWPDEVRTDKTKMELAYQRVQDMLKTKAMPENFFGYTPAKTAALKAAAKTMGFENSWRTTPIYVNFEPEGRNHVGVEQKPCNGCGDCCSGCNNHAKNTMIMNYLPDAKNHGAEIYTQVNVRYVAKVGNQWQVHFNLLQTGEEIFEAATDFITADVVVISAGTLGSTEILLRSKQMGLTCSLKLGDRFSGNGDFLAFGYNNDVRANAVGSGNRPILKEDVVGPCISSVIDLRDCEPMGDGMVIEEGSSPGLTAQAFALIMEAAAATNGKDTDSGVRDFIEEKKRELETLVRGPYHGAINNTMVYLVMTFDDDHGKMYLQDDRLRIDWPQLGRQSIFAKVNDKLYDVTKALGGTYAVDPIWTDTFHKQLITVHPLGGCIMGNTAVDGVVNHKGQVFSDIAGTSVYEGLYVSDGAVVPCALGVNPTLTISALAERSCMYMADDRGWSFTDDFPTVVIKPEEEAKPGIEFTEKMKGYIATADSTGDYTNCYDEGKVLSQNCEFTLNIISEDVQQLIQDPEHEAKIIGTLTAPLISAQPMSVTRGTFNLFVTDPDTVNTKLMEYTLPLKTEDGKRFFFYGFKRIHDDRGFDMWADTTTLFITIYEGDDDKGRVLAKGILRIEVADFQKQLTTIKVLNVFNWEDKIKWEAAFGKYFAGALAEVYGGVLNSPTQFDPDAPARKKRPLNVGPVELIPLTTEDRVTIQLSRYNGGNKGPVMLTHGLGVNSKIFSIDTIDTNLLEYLYAHNYDVWLLDFRASIDLAACHTQFTGDEVAKYDYPAAVKKIREITGADAIDIVAHCYGATTLSMALLSGLQGIRSCVLSQTGPHVITPLATEIKSGLHMPEFLEKLGLDSMDCYTDTHADWKNKLFNKLLQLYPNDAANKTADAVSNRITFTYGQLYEVNNLNNATFQALHEMFGFANIDALKHLSTIVRAKELVDKGGTDVYLPNLKDGMNIPITFIHGDENQCFLPASTEKTYKELKVLNPTQRYSRWVIPNYGHIDCIYGKNAYQDVYPHIVNHLEEVNKNRVSAN